MRDLYLHETLVCRRNRPAIAHNHGLQRIGHGSANEGRVGRDRDIRPDKSASSIPRLEIAGDEHSVSQIRGPGWPLKCQRQKVHSSGRGQAAAR